MKYIFVKWDLPGGGIGVPNLLLAESSLTDKVSLKNLPYKSNSVPLLKKLCAGKLTGAVTVERFVSSGVVAGLRRNDETK